MVHVIGQLDNKADLVLQTNITPQPDELLKNLFEDVINILNQ